MAEEEKASAAEAAPSGKNPLLTVLLAVNALLMGTVAYLQFMAHQREISQPSIQEVLEAQKKADTEGQEKTGEGRENDGILIKLEGFTANLAQGDGPRRFVRLQPVLKFTKASSEEEVKAREPQIRDVIISTLNSKRPEDLLKIEGKNFLKEEIKAVINSFMVDGQVIDVYYASFQIN